MSHEPLTLRQRVQGALRALLAAFTILKQYPVILPVAVITMTNEMNYSGINNITLPAYIKSLHLSVAQLGLITGPLVSVYLLSEAIFRLPSGWLSDRYGRARMITLAMFLLAPSYFLAGLVPHYLWLIPLRFWDGIMAALMWTSVFAIIADSVPNRDRANAMGVINMTYMVGAMLGYLFAGGTDQLTHNLHPRWYMFFAAAVVVMVGMSTFLFFKNRPDLNQPHPEVAHEDIHHQELPKAHHIPLLMVTFLQTLALTSLAPFIYTYATTALADGGLGFNGSELMLLLGVPVLGLALFAIPLSRLADHIGKRNAVRIAFTTVGATLWILAISHALWVMVTVITVVGIAFAMGVPAWLAIISSLGSSEKRGATLGSYGSVQGIAAVLGPLVGSVVLGESARYANLFFVSAGAVMLAAIITWFVLPNRRSGASNHPGSNIPNLTV